MTTASPVSIPGFDTETFEAFLSSRNEADWVKDARRAAYEIFEEKYATELDPEEWKRVDLRTFRPAKYSIKSDGSDATFETLMQDRAEFAGNITHVDGVCTGSKVDQSFTDQGVLFGDLNVLLEEHRELLEPILMKKAVQVDTDRFSAWHAAFRTGGTLLYVPRNVELKQPLHSLIALASDGAADLSHTLVVLEDGASATLLEETVSASPELKGLHIGAVELLVGQLSLIHI